MPVISVVIPIYNVEKYLVRCLDSICNQSLTDMEVICVNDGSTDNCGNICSQYAKKDNRIKIVNKQNGGLSSARNAGMNISCGKYIYFIDPDDYIDPSMLLRMVCTAEKNKCGVVLCGYKTIPDEEIKLPAFELNKSVDPRKMIMNNERVHSHNDLCFVWRFLFQRNIITENKISFNENIFVGEDFIFNLEVLLKASNVYVLGEPLYYYTVDNQDSIMKTRYKRHLESSLILQYEIKKRLSVESGLNKSKVYMYDMALYYINTFLPLMITNVYNGPERDKKSSIKRILDYEMFRESCKQIGLVYRCSNIKEYAAYLAVKYKAYNIVYRIFDKQHRK